MHGVGGGGHARRVQAEAGVQVGDRQGFSSAAVRQAAGGCLPLQQFWMEVPLIVRRQLLQWLYTDQATGWHGQGLGTQEEVGGSRCRHSWCRWRRSMRTDMPSLLTASSAGLPLRSLCARLEGPQVDKLRAALARARPGQRQQARHACEW